MTIRIVTEREPKDGPFALRREYVRVYNEDGTEIKNITAINIDMTPERSIATLSIAGVELDIEADVE